MNTTVTALPLSRRRLLRGLALTGVSTAALATLPHASAAASTAPSRPLASPSAIRAQPSAAFGVLSEQIEAAMRAGGVPGVAVGLFADGQEEVAGFGVTNIAHPLPVDGDTRFQIGSITKTFTALAAMQLVEAGQLALDAPVRRYLPDFRVADTEASARVTIRQLLTHSAGWLGDVFDVTGDGDDALAQAVAAMATLPQVFPAGERFSYNNTGFAVLGRVIEAVSGQPYETVIRARVLGPLGMTASAFPGVELLRHAVASGHAVVEGAPVLASPWGLPRSANPEGGLLASVRDLLRYARFWLGDGAAPAGMRLLTPAGLAAMTTPQIDFPIDNGSVGLSWLIERQGDEWFMQHSGGTIGQTALIAIAPARRLAVVVLSNERTGAALAPLRPWLAARLGWQKPEPPTALPLTRNELAAYAGHYRAEGSVDCQIELTPAGLRLTLRPLDPIIRAAEPVVIEPGDGPPPPPFGLAIAAGDIGFAPDFPGPRLAFARDAGGQICGLYAGARFAPKLA